MTDPPRDCAAFLRRLTGYERFEPLPRSRGPEKLEAVRRLAAALDHPEDHGRVVHLAGTNGKGMTAAMIAHLLHCAGHRTGLYTSPHVLNVRERIVLDGAPIAEPLFARAGHAVLDVADRWREELHFSYFDLLTLIARVAFREQALEWVVVETGLGGLSDATNIGPKELCVLTRIGMDHMHVLGDTPQAIAEQKLGIVPIGMAGAPTVPTVLAEQNAALDPWLRERLAQRGSTVHPAAAFRLEPVVGRPGAVRACRPGVAPLPVALGAGAPDLTAPRLTCAATALAAAEVLLGPATSEAHERRVRAVFSPELAGLLPGRMELRRRQAVTGRSGALLQTVVLDGGHNAEALAALSAQLERWGVSGYTLILSLQRDKLVPQLHGPLAALTGQAARIVTVAPQTARAPAGHELRAFLEGVRPTPAGPPVESVPNALAALDAALATPQRPVVVTGSFWMLGDVMRLLGAGPGAPGAPTDAPMEPDTAHKEAP